MAKCLERVRGVHSSLDSTQFIPMIISNVTTHHALALNQRVNQSQIPLQITMHAQVATMGAGLKFIEFLSKRVLALDVKLGPSTSVSIELGGEGSGAQSTSGEGGKKTATVASPAAPPEKHDASKTSSTGHTPPMADHTYGASKTSKTSGTPAKPRTVFSPKATALLAKLRDTVDADEGMSMSWKRPGGSATQEVLLKKTKVDDGSDSYSSPTPSKSDEPRKEVKKRKTKKKSCTSDDKGSHASGEERTTPKKSSQEDKAEQVNQDCATRWKKDLVFVVKYRQRKGLCAKELVGGPNNTRHVDLLNQLLDEGQLGLNIIHMDDRIEDVEQDTSKYAQRLLKALKEVHDEMMGRSGIYPEYVVKAFLAPQSQSVIQKGNSNHWDTSVMIGLYNLHKYEAIGKGNKKVDHKVVTKGYCPFCLYNAGNNGSINNHVRVHYRLVLECGFTNCGFVVYNAERMIGHAKEKHKHETEA